MKIFLTVCAIVGFWFLMSLFQENVPVLRGAAFHVADHVFSWHDCLFAAGALLIVRFGLGK